MPYQFHSQFLSLRPELLNDHGLTNDAWRLLLYMEDKAGGSRRLKWFPDQASEALDISPKRVGDLLFDEIRVRHPDYAPDAAEDEEFFTIAAAPERGFLRVYTWLLDVGIPTWVLRLLFLVVERHGDRGWRDINLTSLTRRIRGHLPRGTFGRADTRTCSRRKLIRQAIERLATAGLLQDVRWPAGGAGQCRIDWQLMVEGSNPKNEQIRARVRAALASQCTGDHVNQGMAPQGIAAYQGRPDAYQGGDQDGDWVGDLPAHREIPSFQRSHNPGQLPNDENSKGLTALRAVNPYRVLNDVELWLLAIWGDVCSQAYRNGVDGEELSQSLPPDADRPLEDGVLTPWEADFLASWADAQSIADHGIPNRETLSQPTTSCRSAVPTNRSPTDDPRMALPLLWEAREAAAASPGRIGPPPAGSRHSDAREDVPNACLPGGILLRMDDDQWEEELEVPDADSDEEFPEMVRYRDELVAHYARLRGGPSSCKG